MKYENIYNIKIKCLACSESGFIRYENMVVSDSKVIIGKCSFPLYMIEKVTIRYYLFEYKEEIQYKVSAKYLKTLLNEEAQETLADFFEE